MRKHYHRGSIRLALTLGLVALGCSSSTSPGIQPEINNLADSFEFQVTSVANYSKTLDYSWSSSGNTVNVNQATTFSVGSAQLVITDAAGTQVYSRSLAENGTFVSSQGQPGVWKIRVIFSGATGSVNFRVQKKT